MVKVTLGVIALNEENYLADVLADFLAQTYPKAQTEIILIDSGSFDATKRIMEDFARTNTEYLAVKVLDNPQKILPAGCNILLKEYSGDVFIRIDAHARIDADFVEKCVELIEAGEYAVGGVRPCIVPEDASDWQHTLLAIEESAFGSSPANYRGANVESAYVNSIFHGAYHREVFNKIGFYNESLTRTEDNDVSYRIRKAGYKIRLSTDIHSYQIVRPNLKAMLKQKYANGYWIGKTLFIQPKCLGVHHLAPLAFLLSLLICTLIAATWTSKILLVFLLVYGLANVVMSIKTFKYLRKKMQIFVVPFLFFSIHFLYGVGTVVGIVSHLFTKQK